MTRGRKIETLTRRRDYLADRVERGDGSREALSYAAAELSSLTWALQLIHAADKVGIVANLEAVTV